MTLDIIDWNLCPIILHRTNRKERHEISLQNPKISRTLEHGDLPVGHDTKVVRQVFDLAQWGPNGNRVQEVAVSVHGAETVVSRVGEKYGSRVLVHGDPLGAVQVARGDQLSVGQRRDVNLEDIVTVEVRDEHGVS